MKKIFGYISLFFFAGIFSLSTFGLFLKADGVVSSCSIKVHSKRDPSVIRSVNVPPIDGSCDEVCEIYRSDPDNVVVDSCVPVIEIIKNPKKDPKKDPQPSGKTDTSGGLVPCGNSDQERCTLCHLISGIHGLIQWGGKILGIVALFALVVSGVIYLVSAGDSSMMESAKNFMKSALIGTAIFLCAWLIIQTVFYLLGANLSGISLTGNWFTFDINCLNVIPDYGT